MNKLHDVWYCVDLTRKIPVVESMLYSEWKFALEENGLESFKELEGHDFKVFKNIRDAQKFLFRYLDILEDLDDMTHKKRISKKLLYKRRYIVTTLMGLKNYTMRTHNRPKIKEGDLIQFYDQTYFINALITKVENETIDGKKYTRFDYELKHN